MYWTIVSFGPCEYRPVISEHREDVVRSLAEDVNPSNGGPTSWTEAHTWIRGYATREQAEQADVSDGIGVRGRIA
jgi:hypothetical protein